MGELTVAVPSKNSNSVVMLSPFVWSFGAPVVEGHTSTEEGGAKFKPPGERNVLRGGDFAPWLGPRAVEPCSSF
jgi:hypothetical protein